MEQVLIPISQATITLLAKRQVSERDTLDSIIRRLIVQDARKHRTAKNESTRPKTGRGRYRFEILGESHGVERLADVLVVILQAISDLDGDFLSKLSMRSARTRRYVARGPEEIYPLSPQLAKYTAEVRPGWWVGTNYSAEDVRRITRVVCDEVGLTYGTDIRLEF